MKKRIGLAASAATVAVFALSASGAIADEGGPNFTFGSSVSFTYDINDPDLQSTGENVKTYAAPEQDESFNIDLVQVGVSGTRGPVSYGAKLDFGDWAAVVGDSIDGDLALQEAFMAIDTGFATVTAGRMPTPIGYEVLEPWANPNISRSRAWWFQPISHDGLAVAGEVRDVSLMAAVVNGFAINDGLANNVDDEFGIIASAGMPLGDLDLRLATIYSEEADVLKLFQLNGFLAGNYENIRYGLEGTWLDGNGRASRGVGDLSVWDLTAYLGATWSAWSLDLRGAYTDEEGTNAAAVAGRRSNGIWSFTATGGYEITDGVVIRAEYRVDSSQGGIFNDDDDSAGVNPSDLVNVAQFQLLWTPATGS
jgi:hypothetical protein